MASQRRRLVVLLLALALCALSPTTTLSLTCTSQKLSGNNVYQHCDDLPTLNSYLHWTFSPSNRTLSVAFLAPPPSPSGWVSWAINPTATGMAGSQALLASPSPSPDGSISLDTYNIKSYSSVVKGDLDNIRVFHKAAESTNGLIAIYATLSVPPTLTKINHLWQVGPSVSDAGPAPHAFNPANLASIGSLDLSSGVSTGALNDQRTKAKSVHGILNGLSWGILFPVGVVIARYLRTIQSADPAWFYLHVSCQILGYALGVAGWATGLKLGSESRGIVYSTHRAIGIALFCLATLQVFALVARPKKDHKYRFYWNVYHRSVGYAVVVLGVVNVFEGLSILQPGKRWKNGYIVVLVLLACVSVLLEAFTWAVLILGKKSKSNTKSTEPSV